MADDVGADTRLDPRVKAFPAYLGPAEPEGDVEPEQHTYRPRTADEPAVNHYSVGLSRCRKT